ncbi:hypothetical protein Sm713_21400 [Streptomyces sp. TS71-3]|nr:hypothetical protein Sm713_21400 [Streptomyces sp. TS71-3]
MGVRGGHVRVGEDGFLGEGGTEAFYESGAHDHSVAFRPFAVNPAGGTPSSSGAGGSWVLRSSPRPWSVRGRARWSAAGAPWFFAQFPAPLIRYPLRPDPVVHCGAPWFFAPPLP